MEILQAIIERKSIQNTIKAFLNPPASSSTPEATGQSGGKA
jgi:hypothetical protein